MSYLVLARKYRPQNFAEMVGQEHVVAALSNALTQQRLHHAYFFTGTRGVGKTTVSRILAKSLNCVGPDGAGGITAEPCGVCAMCSAIDAGRFVDYTELDAASNRGVDEVQSLLEQAVYKPVQGRFKVFMIDEVHMLSPTAFNAMLKTLEEPPPYLKFVLATTDPQKVPVTVLSRCLQFSLRPMMPQTIQTHLQKVLEAEHVAAEEGALRLIARSARGSMRDALSLTDQAIAFGAGAITEAQVGQMLGAVDQSYVFRLIEALALGDGKAVFDIIHTLEKNGLSGASTLENMASSLQRMAVCQQSPQAHEMQGSEAVEIARLASIMPAEETQLLYSIVIHGASELGLAPDEYTGLSMVLLRLLAFKPKGFRPATLDVAPASAPASASASSALSSEDATEEKKSLKFDQESIAAGAETLADAPPNQISEAMPIMAPPPGMMAVPIIEQGAGSARLDAPIADVEPDAQHEDWVQLVDQLLAAQSVSGLAMQLALQSQCIDKGAAHLTLRVSQPSLKSDSARDELQLALQALGSGLALVIEVGPVQDSWAKRNAARIQARQNQAKEFIEQDPWVQDLIAHWGAKIVPDSIKVV